jgi:hypothetical protein
VIVQVVQGDTLPSLIVNLRTRVDTADCRSAKVAKDLTGIEVRARFFPVPSASEETTWVAFDGVEAPADASLFYRPLTLLETALLGLKNVVAPATPDLYDPIAQPDGPQKIQMVVSNFVGAGSITLTGLDKDDNAIQETLNISANGTFATTTQFASIDEEGISADSGTFDFRLFVHDGKAQLDWEAGDLDVAGRYDLELELIYSSPTRRLTLADTIGVIVQTKRPLPPPNLLTATPDEGFPATTVVFAGEGLLDVTDIIMVSLEDASETAMENLANVLEDGADADVPTGLVGGLYNAEAESAVGRGDPVGFEVLPHVTGFSPDPVTAGSVLTVDGKGFTAATAIDLVDSAGATTALTGISVLTDIQMTGTVPGGTVAGEYSVRVTNAPGVSNDFPGVTVQ